VDIPLVKIVSAVSPDAVDVVIVFNPVFTDLTYGTSSIGWNPKRPHTFKDLYQSDHAQVSFLNGDGTEVFMANIDLISESADAASGYASLGITGGDGAILTGNVSDVLSVGTSMDDNINYYGYELFNNSPATDSAYTPDPEYPFWEFYAVYRISVKPEIFGESGYGGAFMTYVHSSPAKTSSDTYDLTEKPGPPPDDNPFKNLNPNIPFTCLIEECEPGPGWDPVPDCTIEECDPPDPYPPDTTTPL
jgi:hypothetical protein